MEPGHLESHSRKRPGARLWIPALVRRDLLEQDNIDAGEHMAGQVGKQQLGPTYRGASRDGIERGLYGRGYDQ